MRRELYAGVMSGTSLDGVDAVVADFAPASVRACEVLGAAAIPFDTILRDELAKLQRPTLVRTVAHRLAVNPGRDDVGDGDSG